MVFVCLVRNSSPSQPTIAASTLRSRYVVTLDFAIVKKTYTSIEADGAIAVKTKQAILVGEYAAPVQAGEATTVVEGLADYLIGVGY